MTDKEEFEDTPKSDRSLPSAPPPSFFREAVARRSLAAQPSTTSSESEIEVEISLFRDTCLHADFQAVDIPVDDLTAARGVKNRVCPTLPPTRRTPVFYFAQPNAASALPSSDGASFRCWLDPLPSQT
jgi:hypothetical protein